MPKSLRTSQRVATYVLGALLLLAVGAKRLQAQAVTGNISGTVTDSSGAVIAGANIQVKNTATGVTQIRVQCTGPLQRSRLDRRHLQRPGLQQWIPDGGSHGHQFHCRKPAHGRPFLARRPGPADRNGRASVAQVETQSTAISSLINPQQMVDLPLNGRNFEQLLNIAPGVTPTGAGTTTLYGTGPGFSIAGARTEGELFLLDNTNMSDFWNHQAGSQVLGTSLGVEAIQEFSLLTSTYSAQFGGNGAVMNAASKSGTNDFHGSAYEFLRNSALDSRSYFETASDLNKLPFRRNQFGGSVGGPVKKNKLFFFGNYEGFRQALAQPVTNVGYPEPYVASGELPCSVQFPANPSCPAGASGTPGSGTNPILPIPEAIGSGATGQTAAAASAINGILGIYNKFAPPPAAGAPDQGGYYFGTISATQRSREDYVLGRVDYTLSSKDSIFGRYVFDKAYNLSPLTGFFGAALPSWPEVDHSKNQFFTAEERHIFSSNVVNNLRFMFIRTFESSFSNSTLPAATDPLNFIPSRY